MPEQFAQVDRGRAVFRLAERGKTFLPSDARLPLPEWFQPTSADRAEGEKRGRPAGVSVWVRGLTTLIQAQLLVDKPGAEGFQLGVDQCLAIGQEHGRELEVVHDPLEKGVGGEGHALIEGLKRPGGTARKAQKDLLATMAEACSPLAEESSE